MQSDPRDFHLVPRSDAVPADAMADTVLGLIWARMCARRRATGRPLPPDHLRPPIAGPTTERTSR